MPTWKSTNAGAAPCAVQVRLDVDYPCLILSPTQAWIDALVYELYGLGEEEIAIVEGRDH